MKYKPCCGIVCCVPGCKVKSQGGCYCVCRLVDMISGLESAISGRSVARGCVYCSNPKDGEKWFNNLSEEEQEKELYFRNVEAPELLKHAKLRLKEKHELP